MDISRASTEPHHRFIQFMDDAGRSVRVSVGGLHLVRQAAGLSAAQSVPFVLPADGEPWGDRPWETDRPWKTAAITRSIGASKKFIAEMGIVRCITALEDFCVGVLAEYDRDCAVRGRPRSAGLAEIDEPGFTPSKLYHLLNWDREILDAVAPLFEYFSTTRHCIVHRAGRANKTWKECAESPDLLRSIQTWHGRSERSLPRLPNVQVHDEIPILPRHANLADEVCRRIAGDANAKLRRFLDKEGIFRMATYHSAFSPRPVKLPAHRTPAGTLNFILSDRYRVQLEDDKEAAQTLIAMSEWKKYTNRWQKVRGRPL